MRRLDRAGVRLSDPAAYFVDVPAKLVSVNVGLPAEVRWKGGTVLTSIFKKPVDHAVHVTKLNLDGDEQSDLTVHGGVDKAVYAYPLEHYPFWQRQYPALDLPFGMFGENLTVEGLLETQTNIGDRLGIGTAEFRVTQPRIPCFKLGIRFGDPKILKTFLRSGRPGFYLAVTKEGLVQAGDSLKSLEHDEHGVSVTDIVSLYSGASTDRELLKRAAELPTLPLGWRNHLRQRLTDS